MGLTTPLQGQDSSLPSIEEHTAGMDLLEGYFNLYWDETTGSLFWEIAEVDSEFLYPISMGSGLGSNPVGIGETSDGLLSSTSSLANVTTFSGTSRSGVSRNCGER